MFTSKIASKSQIKCFDLRSSYMVYNVLYQRSTCSQLNPLLNCSQFRHQYYISTFKLSSYWSFCTGKICASQFALLIHAGSVSHRQLLAATYTIVVMLSWSARNVTVSPGLSFPNNFPEITKGAKKGVVYNRWLTSQMQKKTWKTSFFHLHALLLVGLAFCAKKFISCLDIYVLH